jgi:hypothetical protein
MVVIGLGVFAVLDGSVWFGSAGALFKNKGANTEINCLALNIYWEARSEPKKGQIAVAQVTVNRVNHPKYPNTSASNFANDNQISITVLPQSFDIPTAVYKKIPYKCLFCDANGFEMEFGDFGTHG